jgi:midasin
MPYNIYAELNVAEARLCVEPLANLTARVRELLTEWPEHPVLQQLVKVANRVVSFRLSSPLMQFLSGLELLLRKAQEWEINASSRVTLQAYLEPISRLVLRCNLLQ